MPFRDAWLPVGILLALIGYGADEPAIIGVGIAILAIGAATRYWHRHLFDRVEITRTVSARRAFIDEPVQVNVTIENKKVLPLPWFEWRLTVADTFTSPDETLSASAAPGSNWLVRRGAMGWYERQTWTATIKASERGHHPIGPLQLKSSDMLGMFPGTMLDERIDPIVVFPRVFPLDELGLESDRPMGERKGRNRLIEDPMRIAGLREYRPGDPLRRIDWKATARSGELMSRVYEPSATQQLFLMVNIDTFANSWEGYLKEDLERTISTAASVAVWGAGNRFSLGIMANGSFPGSDRPIRLAPSRSREQLTRVLEALAVIQPLTMGDLASSMQRELGRIPVGSTVVVVASFIPPELAAVVNRMGAEGHRTTVITTSDRADTSLLMGVDIRAVGGMFEREGVFV